MSLQQRMESSDYELILISYPEDYDIKQLREIKYNISKGEDTVVPMDKNVYQNIIPLINNDKKMKVANPFVDGVSVVAESKSMALEDEKIDFYHSTKEPKYNCVDWRNITVAKEPRWPLNDFDYEPYKKQVLSKKLAKEKDRNEKKIVWQRILIIMCFLIGVGASSKLIEHKITDLAGEHVEGMPMITWVAMGLCESKAAPGWYNGLSAELYSNNNFEYEATVDDSLDFIHEKIIRSVKDPGYAIDFYSRKILSMWNNPQFSSLEMISSNSGTIWDYLFKNEGRYIYVWINNLIHTWILIGVFLYAVLSYKTISYKKLLLPISIVGGFVFHIFWEAKCMYAMPYVVLMLPLSISGYMKWSEWLKEYKGKKRLLKKGLLLGVTVVCLLSYTEIFTRIIARDDDTTRYDTYTRERVIYDREEIY